MEEDLHSVAPGRYDWRQEVHVIGRRWIQVAAAVVHQDCPVPICDFDKVASADIKSTTRPNRKGGELQSQYRPTFDLYRLCLVMVVRIVVGVVWRGNDTYGKESLIISSSRKCCLIYLHHSPWVPQPSAGQSESISCQNPAPVVDSRTQARLCQHWPQQHCASRC